MQGQNPGPVTPLVSGRSGSKNNNTFTKISSVSDMHQESQSSERQSEEIAYQQLLFTASPHPNPSFVAQKHWWTPEEDERLKQLVQQYGAKNWKKIASFLENRTDVQCLHRWQKVLNPALIKGPWVLPQKLRQKKRMTSFFSQFGHMDLRIGALLPNIFLAVLGNNAVKDGTIIQTLKSARINGRKKKIKLLYKLTKSKTQLTQVRKQMGTHCKITSRQNRQFDQKPLEFDHSKKTSDAIFSVR